ncbi:hypothetical protein BHE17_11960 [Planococcus maritimus]|nr:hypothetical protein BHE17_11960 [Planococcus maritimus]
MKPKKTIKQNKRIVLIRSNPVSPYPRLEKTANSLAKNGYEVEIIGWDRDNNYKEKITQLNFPDSKVTITRFGILGTYGGGIKKNTKALLKFQKRVFTWLIKNRRSYDVIHAYDFDTGYVSLLAAKLLNKKLVYDIPDYYVDSHNLKETQIGNYIKKFEHSVINKAEAVIICTEKRKKQIAGTSPNKLIVVHNSPVNIKNTSKKIKLLNEENNKVKIVYVGILAEGRFIKELAEIVINRKDCELHIAGFGKFEEYFIMLSKEYTDIYYYGKISYAETLDLEKQCDILTAIYDPSIPNHFYAAPNKFYESLMLGKPLIMVKDTGMDHIILENKIGVVINYTKDSLNDGISSLIEKKNQWPNISGKSKKIYEKEFSWEIMENRILKLYKDL